VKRSAKAYTLAELVVVVVFVGILSAIAIPRINFAIIRKTKANTTAEQIVSGLRRTRRLAISDAAKNSDGYSFEMKGGTPYSGFEIKNEDNNNTIDTFTFDADVTITNDNEFNFGPLGNLLTVDTQIDVAAEGRSFTIRVVPATGMIKCVKN
jgi:Tfp pilus assembly protein FimT